MEPNETQEIARQNNELLKKQLIWMRVIAVLLAALLITVPLFLNSTARSMDRVSDAMAQVDFAGAVEQLKKLDMQTLSDSMAEFDVAAFNKAVDNLNQAVDGFREASDAVKAWSDHVSEGFGNLFGRK